MEGGKRGAPQSQTPRSQLREAGCRRWGFVLGMSGVWRGGGCGGGSSRPGAPTATSEVQRGLGWGGGNEEA